MQIAVALVIGICSSSSVWLLYQGMVEWYGPAALYLFLIVALAACTHYLFRTGNRQQFTLCLAHLLLFASAHAFGSILFAMAAVLLRQLPGSAVDRIDWGERLPDGRLSALQEIGEYADRIRDNRLQGSTPVTAVPLIDEINYGTQDQALMALRVVARHRQEGLEAIVDAGLDNQDMAVRVLSTTIKSDQET